MTSQKKRPHNIDRYYNQYKPRRGLREQQVKVKFKQKKEERSRVDDGRRGVYEIKFTLWEKKPLRCNDLESVRYFSVKIGNLIGLDNVAGLLGEFLHEREDWKGSVSSCLPFLREELYPHGWFNITGGVNKQVRRERREWKKVHQEIVKKRLDEYVEKWLYPRPFFGFGYGFIYTWDEELYGDYYA